VTIYEPFIIMPSNTAKLLKFIEKALNEVTFCVECSIVVSLFFSVPRWQNNRFFPGPPIRRTRLPKPSLAAWFLELKPPPKRPQPWTARPFFSPYSDGVFLSSNDRTLNHQPFPGSRQKLREQF